MNIERFFYNPDNRKFYFCDCSHVQGFISRKGILKKPFDYYIRGIIKDNNLYLRAYYPYNDILYISHKEIMQKSLDLLTIYREEIQQGLKENGYNIREIKINVSNEDLKHFLNTQYV